ncbi:hypothetical protein ACFVJ8_34075 [Streptomyces yangpuensis]|uniref:hypothetical protein n=1 Tax=Streptomyces yangpuensis TaxID=1648182 RepID=UPI0036371657
MGELDRPEAAVGDDQVSRTAAAGQLVGKAPFAVAVAPKAGIKHPGCSDLGEDHHPHLGEPEGDATRGGRAVEGLPLLTESGRSKQVSEEGDQLLDVTTGKARATMPPGLRDRLHVRPRRNTGVHG